MNTLNGYSKGNDANTSVLLAAGGSKPLSDFVLNDATYRLVLSQAIRHSGRILYTDPEFSDDDINGIHKYANSGSSSISLSRIEDNQNSANSSGYIVQIQTTGSGTSPGLGGFYQTITSRSGAVFAQIFRAKIPSGYYLTTASNSMGDNYSNYWITDNKGTNTWEWYVNIRKSGISGTFSSSGHVYLSASGTASYPVTWYLSYCTAFDMTKADVDAGLSQYVYNLLGGSINRIPYQTSANNTSFIAAPSSSGQMLQWNGSSFIWNSNAVSASSVSRATFGDKDNGSHDANAIKSNGLWYYTSNGPTTTLGATTSDGALYSQAYNTSWVGQIAQDYRNGKLFVRGLNNGTWTNWLKVAMYNEVLPLTGGTVTGDVSVKSLTVTGSDNLLVQGNVTAASFIKNGGTASQVLMADGSVKTMSQIVSGGESTKYWANVTISSSSNDQTAPTFKSQTIKITDTNVASSLFSNTTTYQIGTTKRELHLNYSSGSGTGVNDGRLSAITFGNSASYAGIYVQSSGSYGSRMIFGTTSSFANGSYGRVIIDNSGNVGIGTMSPSYKLHVNGTTMITNDLTLYATSGSSPFLNFRRGTYTDDLDDWRMFANGSGFFIQRTSGSTTNWVNRFMLSPNVSSGTNAAYLYSDDGTSDRIVTQSMVVTSSANGAAPKVINTNTATVTSAYYVLASSTGSNTPSWYKLPSTAFSSGQTYSLVTGSANGLVHAPISSQSSATEIASSYYVYATTALNTDPQWYKAGCQVHLVQNQIPTSTIAGDIYFLTSNA